MHAGPRPIANDDVVALFDDMPMRRAQLVAFLDHWASGAHVKLVAGDVSKDRFGGQETGLVRMIIIAIGGDSLDRSGALPLINGGHQFWSSEVPVVIISDRTVRRDVEAAFAAGARGYIPSSTEPEVALQALTFILNGGHFFPSTAL